MTELQRRSILTRSPVADLTVRMDSENATHDFDRVERRRGADSGQGIPVVLSEAGPVVFVQHT